MNIAKLPPHSGVYILKNREGVPIYVGKSTNIRKRVKTHLSSKEPLVKQKVIIEKTKSVAAIQVDSEVEALILEAALIKKFRPLYNSQLKDDKGYLYIVVTKDRFPRILAGRKRDIRGAKTYFGPFPSAAKVRTTLKTLRRVFRFSSCRPSQKRPCLYYHLGLCPGVCVGLISEEKYRENITKLLYFFKGGKRRVLSLLEKKLKQVSKNLDFEQATTLRDQIQSLKYVIKPMRAEEHLDEELEQTREKELSELAKVLTTSKKLKRIECYDISNMVGSNATGSMVVFINGLADSGEYRRFKIRNVRGINDTAMITEVLERRFHHSEWPVPNLVVVDGGRGQLNAALSITRKVDPLIPVISLAKRFEEIYIPERKKPLKLPNMSNVLRLVQRIRDEAHRFALAYHRKLRSRQFLTRT